MPQDKPIRLKLPMEVHNAIAEIAFKYKISVPATITQMLNHFIDDDLMMERYFKRATFAKDIKATSSAQDRKTDTISNRDIAPNCTVNTPQRLDKNIRAYMEGEAERRPHIQFELISSSKVRMSYGGVSVVADIKDQEAYFKAIMKLPKTIKQLLEEFRENFPEAWIESENRGTEEIPFIVYHVEYNDTTHVLEDQGDYARMMEEIRGG